MCSSEHCSYCKMKNKSVSVLAWHELTDMKWVPCGILDSLSVQFEHINEITSYARPSGESVTHQLSQTKTRT